MADLTSQRTRAVDRDRSKRGGFADMC